MTYMLRMQIDLCTEKEAWTNHRLTLLITVLHVTNKSISGVRLGVIMLHSKFVLYNACVIDHDNNSFHLSPILCLVNTKYCESEQYTSMHR